jgi:hypothetical protein
MGVLIFLFFWIAFAVIVGVAANSAVGMARVGAFSPSLSHRCLLASFFWHFLTFGITLSA